MACSQATGPCTAEIPTVAALRLAGDQVLAWRAFMVAVPAPERSSSRSTQRRARRSDSGLSGTVIVTRLPVHGSRTVRVILGRPQNHHQSARLRAKTL